MIPQPKSRERLPFPAKFRALCTLLDRWTIRTIRSYGSDQMVSRHLGRGAVKRAARLRKRSRATVYKQYVGAYAGK